MNVIGIGEVDGKGLVVERETIGTEAGNVTTITQERGLVAENETTGIVTGRRGKQF